MGERIVMNTLDFIIRRYNIDLNKGQFPIGIPHKRWREMSVLFKELGYKKGVEVGVYKGEFSKALCAGNPKLELTGIDSWSAYTGYNEYQTEDLDTKIYAEALANTAGYKVSLIKSLSMDAVKDFEDESLDFVFIDANHDYKYVLEDIAAWSRKVRLGGIVCGHDYIKTAKYDFGVIEAVNKWCADNNIKILFIWNDKCPSWMYVKE